MITSTDVDKIYPAYIAMQAALAIAAKDSDNPHFKSKYANLESLWLAARPALATHGLAVLQSPSFDNGRIFIRTRIIHGSGQYIECLLSLKPDKDSPQSAGSCITYLKRYTLAAILGIIDAFDETDDDGNGCSPDPKKNEEKSKYIPPNVPRNITPPKPQDKIIFISGEPRSEEWLEKSLVKRNTDLELKSKISVLLHNKDLTDYEEKIGHLSAAISIAEADRTEEIF